MLTLLLKRFLHVWHGGWGVSTLVCQDVPVIELGTLRLLSPLKLTDLWDGTDPVFFQDRKQARVEKQYFQGRILSKWCGWI